LSGSAAGGCVVLLYAPYRTGGLLVGAVTSKFLRLRWRNAITVYRGELLQPG